MGWAIRLAKHVESLHEHGVAHGNVSPACVLLSSADPSTPGFMSDVRRTTESVPYHSPERMRGGQLSPADDTWAIAATLYTALTSSPPFVGASEAELQEQVVKGAHAPLAVYGVDDDRLDRLLKLTFAADIGKRLSNVAMLRRELERLHPNPGNLQPLDDEEVGDEDQAATAMLNMSGEESGRAESMKGLFAPPSFQADSRMGDASATDPPPPAGGDATVMRELPAHIMKMAARAASGSNPPPANEAPAPAPPPAPSAPRAGGPPRPAAPPSQPKPPMPPQAPAGIGAPKVPQDLSPLQESEGDATRVGPSPAAVIAALRSGGPLGAGGPQAPGNNPGAPPGAPRPGFAPGTPPEAPRAPVPPPRPSAPGPQRPGFAPPPAPAASDPDDVRTVMHAGDMNLFALTGGAGAPAQGGPAGAFSQAAPPAAPRPPMAPPAAGRAPEPAGAQPAPAFGGPQPSPFAPAPKPGTFPQGAPAFAPPPGPQFGQGPAAKALAPPVDDAHDDDDDDDGARTVMRESPMLTPDMISRATAKPLVNEPSNAGWQQAAPPPQPSSPGFGQGSVQAVAGRTAPMQRPQGFGPPPGGAPIESATSGFGQQEPPKPQAQAPAVSALIQEALAELPSQLPSQGASSVESPSQLNQNLSSVIGNQQGFNQSFAPNAPPQFQNPSFTPPGFPQQNASPSGAPYPPDQAGAAPPFQYPTGPAVAVAPEEKPGRGWGSLAVICLLVLVLATAVTFIVLKYRGKLGLSFLGTDAPTATAPPSSAAKLAPSAYGESKSAAPAAPTASAAMAPAPSASASAAPASSSEPKSKK